MRAVILRQLTLLAAAALAGCAHAPALEGRIWDTRAGAFVSEAELVARAKTARYVILGEIHDNAEHHRLQRRVLDALVPQNRTLAMEQFDSEYQAAIDAARPQGAEALADAGRFDRKGWNWPLYKPLVQFALERGWPLAAANLSRTEARAIVAEPARSQLPLDLRIQKLLEKDIVEGHCGQAPEPKRLAGMIAAQRARDARMASVLKEPSVLIAGRAHARRDRGVPLYLGGADVVSIAFTEASGGPPENYEPGSYDYLWFTARAARDDPCS